VCATPFYELDMEGGDSEVENTVLCGANSYEEKYYFNQAFDSLPQEVKDELRIMCVLYTEDIGGILLLEFDEEGNLSFKVVSDPGDYLFDEIGSELKIKQYQTEKRELLESLELYYRTFFMGDGHS
ncbi:DUF6145 family protein, partial [Olsenella profusa]